MSESTYLLMREVGTGIISLMLIVLTTTLTRYLYRHRKATATEDKAARNIAIGLTLFFGAVAFRSTELWAMLIMTRNKIAIPDLIETTFQSPVLYICTLGAAIFGAICTVRSLNPGLIWSILIVCCVLIPVAVAFL